MIYRAFLPVFCSLALLAAATAEAQQYRWIDKDGRVQYTDAPPPPSAKDVRKSSGAAATPATTQAQFELARVQKESPITLYTSPNCKEGCNAVRGALNRRGLAFKEVLVWDQASNDELKRVSGAQEVPTLLVGRSIQRGFEQEGFDSLLDSAGYPRTGTLPPLSQKAPGFPEGYAPPADATAKPAAAAPPTKGGRYDASGLTGPAPKPGQYDPSGLTGPPPKTGKYGVPGEAK